MAPSVTGYTFGVDLATTKLRENMFERLVSDLSRLLGPSSGITSEDVDVQELYEYMERYVSQEREWSKYAFSDFSRGSLNSPFS